MRAELVRKIIEKYSKMSSDAINASRVPTHNMKLGLENNSVLTIDIDEDTIELHDDFMVTKGHNDEHFLEYDKITIVNLFEPNPDAESVGKDLQSMFSRLLGGK